MPWEIKTTSAVSGVRRGAVSDASCSAERVQQYLAAAHLLRQASQRCTLARRGPPAEARMRRGIAIDMIVGAERSRIVPRRSAACEADVDAQAQLHRCLTAPHVRSCAAPRPRRTCSLPSCFTLIVCLARNPNEPCAARCSGAPCGAPYGSARDWGRHRSKQIHITWIQDHSMPIVLQLLSNEFAHCDACPDGLLPARWTADDDATTTRLAVSSNTL